MGGRKNAGSRERSAHRRFPPDPQPMRVDHPVADQGRLRKHGTRPQRSTLQSGTTCAWQIARCASRNGVRPRGGADVGVGLEGRPRPWSGATVELDEQLLLGLLQVYRRHGSPARTARAQHDRAPRSGSWYAGSRPMTVSRLVARPMLASMFVVGGSTRCATPRPSSPKAEPVTDEISRCAGSAGVPVPDDGDAGADQRRRPDRRRRSRSPPAGPPALRRSCWRLAGRRRPSPATGSGRRRTRPAAAQQRIHFFKNVSMLGGLLIAAVDTDGKPGVAWRARRAAKDAAARPSTSRREAAPRGPAGREGQPPEPPRPLPSRRLRVTSARPTPGPRPAPPDRSTPSSRCPAPSR